MTISYCGIWNITKCHGNVTNRTSVSRANETMIEFVIELYFIGVLCLVGMFGNIVAVIVLRRDRERRESLFLLQALAVADGFYLTVALLRYPLKYMVNDRHVFYSMQLYVLPLLKTAQTSTIWMMVLVTVDRFIYVCVPLRAHQLFNHRSRQVYAVAVFLFAILFNLPRFFQSCLMELHDLCRDQVTIVVAYTMAFNNQLYYDIYQLGLYIIVLYLVPLTVLVLLNLCLIKAINRSRRRHRAVTGTADHSETNATLVLVIIVLVFILCETPELIFRLITVFERTTKSTFRFATTKRLTFSTIVELLMVINSSANFFIYCAFGRRFRHVMRETFRYRGGQSTQLTHESVPLQQQLYQG